MAIEAYKQVYNRYVPRFGLEPYRGRKSRFTCPVCAKKEVFTRYIDYTTGDYLDDNLGRCNRESKCGYHQPPTKEIIDKLLKQDEKIYIPIRDVKEELIKYVNRTDLIEPKEVVRSTISYENNKFVQFLLKYFSYEEVMKTIDLYKVGSSDKWKGATIFWQIDEDFDVRTGKIMLYDEESGKRVKQPYNHISWVHNHYSDFQLKQCFFGQHLLGVVDESKLVCVVESEKTAVICNLSKTNCIWLATGGLQNINEDRIVALAGRKVIFYPDKGDAYEKWCEKLKPYMGFGDFTISDYLNKESSLKDGEDLGDLVIDKLSKND